MTRDAAIVELADWLQTPPGRYLLDWEQQRLDAAVVDLFGFHALQLGLPELEALRANRMPHRWLAQDALGQQIAGTTVLRCDFDALPFESNSLDLIMLPHALELSRDPHQTLREVERVLRPEGRVVINGFNPASLWGLRQNLGRLTGGPRRPLFMPRTGEFIGYWRLRDWLRLLGFEVEAAQFGAYRPPLKSERWLERWSWIERIGSRWWPVLGAVYFVMATKKVHGMRLVGLAKRSKRAAAPQTAPAVATQHRQTTTHR
ncbi:class I SAM-dependent methyltransferase [Pelomonas sp. SE-A7]|uniref:class I SAM-dependent methyltransferase n=1 Tax=Pelomonas sp. SE-A7 TaxID=3054953 RepID=UPI00259D01CE|nr:class I SAM-dependent methyltransferase [Pelomonas sp. SE-A7]MDM4765934.1 methyltransferase domain-containing protein [Pelomonas sp. SE-A7]